MIHDTLAGLDDHFQGVCIIGAGPVGISLAIELERLRIPVLLLESGGYHSSASVQSLAEAEFVDPDRHDAMSIATARRLGGTSNLWGARCLIYDPIDFAPRPGLVDARWPITYDELSPYYQRACELTASGEPSYSLPIPGVTVKDGSFTCDSLERWANKQKLHVIHRETLRKSRLIDVRLHAVVVDIGMAGGGHVRDIEIVRPDGSGRHRLKVDRLVIAAGGLESTRLMLAMQQNHPALFGTSDGPLGRYYMGHVIGEIADIVLATQELDRAFNFFVDTHGTYVRRRFALSPETQKLENVLNTVMWPVVPPVADARHGSSILSLVYLALANGPMGRLFIAEAIRKRHIPEEPQAILTHVRNIITGMPHAVTGAADFLRRRYATRARLPGFFVHNIGRRYGLSYHGEHSPDPLSRITLAEGADRLGLPKLKIDFRFPEKDIRSVVKVHDLFERWLANTGFGRLEYRMPRDERESAVMSQARHGTHQIGTIRMGSDAREGVVDGNLRSFDLANLFVVSTAVLPTSSQANPTLTAIALAVRLAQLIAVENGKPAVIAGRKTPVDPATPHEWFQAAALSAN